MKVVTKKFKSGERYVFLLDDDGVPDFWVTHFVTQKLRMGHAATSIECYLKSIKHLKLWETMNGRDLLEEIYHGAVPSSDDINALKEHCSYQVKGIKKQKKSQVTDMGKFYSYRSEDKPTVSKLHYTSRISHIGEYLHFCGQERVKNKPTATQLNIDLDMMKSCLKRGMPKNRLKKTSKKSSIPNDVYEDFVAVAKPNSPHNPFGSEVRLRNYLLVQTLYETGFRRAELVALRISDVGTDIDDPTLTVERRHNSKDDPRVKEPTAKTLGRTVSISKGLRNLLNRYIRTERLNTQTAKTHPFIFVAHKEKTGFYKKGDPISLQTVNDVFGQLRNVNFERFWAITPHGFRHFFNTRLDECITKELEAIKQEVARLETEGKHLEAKQYDNEYKITAQNKREIHAEFNGHSSLNSSQIYLKKALDKQCNNIRKTMHSDLMHKIEGE